jgi:hypothetical protein
MLSSGHQFEPHDHLKDTGKDFGKLWMQSRFASPKPSAASVFSDRNEDVFDVKQASELPSAYGFTYSGFYGEEAGLRDNGLKRCIFYWCRGCRGFHTDSGFQISGGFKFWRKGVDGTVSSLLNKKRGCANREECDVMWCPAGGMPRCWLFLRGFEIRKRYERSPG